MSIALGSKAIAMGLDGSEQRETKASILCCIVDLKLWHFPFDGALSGGLVLNDGCLEVFFSKLLNVLRAVGAITIHQINSAVCDLVTIGTVQSAHVWEVNCIKNQFIQHCKVGSIWIAHDDVTPASDVHDLLFAMCWIMLCFLLFELLSWVESWFGWRWWWLRSIFASGKLRAPWTFVG